MFEKLKRRLAGRAPGGQREPVSAAAVELPPAAQQLLQAAHARLAEGRAGEALAVFHRVIEIVPGHAEAYYGLGLAHRALGADEPARASFERAIEIRHDYVDALAALGATCADLGRLEDAADNFQLALAFDAGCAGAHLGLGRLLKKQGNFGDAADHLRIVVKLAPDSAEVCFELAQAVNQLGHADEAIKYYQRAMQIRPDHAETCVNLGMIFLGQRGEPERAEVLFRRACGLAPALLAAQTNLGLALQEQGRFEEALRHYEAQLALHPEADELRWNRGVLQLTLGNFSAGWDDYEARKRRDRGDRKFPYPEWDGAPLAGRSILVYGEQGLGDEIMFASCLPDVIVQAKACVIECDERLAGLYRRSFPQARVHGARRDGGRDWLQAFPDIELQSAIGSLPRHLRRGADRFPRHAGYLAADIERVAAWRQRLSQLGPEPKVGISWRGGTLKTRSGLRSIPLAAWSPLLGWRGARFVSLQRRAVAEDLEQLRRQCGSAFTAWPEVLEDIDDTAALIAALDLVISVDNTVAHLAGALGRPAWVLLPRSPDWRYQWRGETVPWYPSQRLLRQGASGAWEPVIAAAAARLQRIVERGTPGDNDAYPLREIDT